MAAHLKKSIIIEFNGLPASGKSTVAKELLRVLDENEIPVIKRHIKYQWQKNGWTAYLDFQCLKLRRDLNAFASSIQPKRNRETFIMGWLARYRSYRDSSRLRGNHIYVCDQGLLQSLVSIAYPDKITDGPLLNKCLEKINLLTTYFVVVNCRIEPTVCAERLRNRPHNPARMYDIPEEDVVEAMKSQNANFSILRSASATILKNGIVIPINMHDSVEINVKKIYNTLITNGIID